jgi:hypothetical protein
MASASSPLFAFAKRSIREPGFASTRMFQVVPAVLCQYGTKKISPSVPRKSKRTGSSGMFAKRAGPPAAITMARWR